MGVFKGWLDGKSPEMNTNLFCNYFQKIHCKKKQSANLHLVAVNYFINNIAVLYWSGRGF